MGKEKAANSIGALVSELFQFGVYKGSQGKATRQVTFALLAVTIFLGVCRLFTVVLRPQLDGPGTGYLIAGAVLGLGLWLSYRIVNYPPFADFLIAVEAEMNKVSWPTRGVLVRSSMVVIFVILALAGILFCYDLLWKWLFHLLGIVKTAKEASG